MNQYEALPGGDFAESFLMKVELVRWPNDLSFRVWSPGDQACYCIAATTVLEFHFLRSGTGSLIDAADGIPLGNIFRTYEDEHDYWSARIKAFANKGLDGGEDPICLEFDSHLFANRQRQVLNRDRNTGILVVCRHVHVEHDRNYDGPTPAPHKIL
jgi:hypothetical protein